MLYLTLEETLSHRMGAKLACSWFPVQSQENGQIVCLRPRLHRGILDQAIARCALNTGLKQGILEYMCPPGQCVQRDFPMIKVKG